MYWGIFPYKFDTRDKCPKRHHHCVMASSSSTSSTSSSTSTSSSSIHSCPVWLFNFRLASSVCLIAFCPVCVTCGWKAVSGICEMGVGNWVLRHWRRVTHGSTGIDWAVQGAHCRMSPVHRLLVFLRFCFCSDPRNLASLRRVLASFLPENASHN